jgi:hypothetical protein
MAELPEDKKYTPIEKALPNIEKLDADPGQNRVAEDIDVEVEGVEKLSDNPAVTELADGGVEVNFDPSQINPQDPNDHFANLAELLPANVLGPLGSDLFEKHMDYKMSRKEWETTYVEGLDLLGFKYYNRTQPFDGASGATHPVLAEAVTQFQAQAYKELLPAEGPVRTQVLGVPTPQKDQQAKRVKNYMNYMLMDQMHGYDEDFDKMLFYLPLAGSTFKKVYYNALKQQAVSEFVQADDLLVPYSATNLEDAECVIHVLKMSGNEIRKQQVAGFYRDISLGTPTMFDDPLTQKERELEGQKKTKPEDIYTLYECHTNLNLEGFEDINPQTGEPTGIKLPYIVTIDAGSRSVLSIRRNYAPNDPNKNKIDYFVHFKFLPGLGFYGFGLIHMIGGLSRTATVALRQLLDAGTLSNLPAGFKMRGIRIRDDASPLQPGEWRDVDAPGGNLKDSFMNLPYKEPSPVLFQLLGTVVAAGQRFASIADTQVGDGNQQAAVGTTVALLERGSRVMSAIHKRLYASLRDEFKLLAKIFGQYLPPEYPYDVVGAQRTIKAADFDDRVDILPVADPNIFSQTQRISIAQTELQLAMSNPQLHNLYECYRSMYSALGVKDIDKVLPPPKPPQPIDPALEHIDALAMKPFQAYMGQDHRAHVSAHLHFMALNMVRNNPTVMAAIEKNILEHISLMAQEQVQMEFKEEIKKIQQMQQMANQNPQMAQQIQPQIVQMTQQIEARKAVLIAEFMEEFMKEEKTITSQFDHDPLLKIKSREVDLKAMDTERKQQEMEQRKNIENAKLISKEGIEDDKLEQNEDLAILRADTSLTKQHMSDVVKMDIANMKRKDVKTLKGPKR